MHVCLLQLAELDQGSQGGLTNPSHRKWFVIIADQQTPAENRQRAMRGAGMEGKTH